MTSLRRDSVEHHFWENVSKTDSCWVWTGWKHSKGYGQFEHNFVRYWAHRFSWEMHYGLIPKGMQVCHHCDNPPCVNPAHLFLGTHDDNLHDAVMKGRFPRGEKHRHAKLTSEQVKEIRERYAQDDVLHRELAEEYGVTRRTIGRAIKGQDWGWLK